MPLVSIEKKSFNSNDHILEFYCEVTSATLFAKKLLKKEETFDISLYLYTYPSR